MSFITPTPNFFSVPDCLTKCCGLAAIGIFTAVVHSRTRTRIRAKFSASMCAQFFRLRHLLQHIWWAIGIISVSKQKKYSVRIVLSTLHNSVSLHRFMFLTQKNAHRKKMEKNGKKLKYFCDFASLEATIINSFIARKHKRSKAMDKKCWRFSHTHRHTLNINLKLTKPNWIVAAITYMIPSSKDFSWRLLCFRPQKKWNPYFLFSFLPSFTWNNNKLFLFLFIILVTSPVTLLHFFHFLFFSVVMWSVAHLIFCLFASQLIGNNLLIVSSPASRLSSAFILMVPFHFQRLCYKTKKITHFLPFRPLFISSVFDFFLANWKNIHKAHHTHARTRVFGFEANWMKWFEIISYNLHLEFGRCKASLVFQWLNKYHFA